MNPTTYPYFKQFPENDSHEKLFPENNSYFKQFPENDSHEKLFWK